MTFFNLSSTWMRAFPHTPGTPQLSSHQAGDWVGWLWVFGVGDEGTDGWEEQPEPSGWPAGDALGAYFSWDIPAVLTGNTSEAAAGASRSGKILFPRPSVLPVGFQLPVLEICGAGCDLCPQGSGTARAQPQPCCFLLCSGSLGKNLKKYLKCQMAAQTLHVCKWKSFGKLLCANAEFVDVLSSEHLLFSVCIGLPKAMAFTS